MSASVWSPAGFLNAVSSALISFIQYGVGAVTRTLQAKSRDIFDCRDFGADPANTPAQNKAALQLAITAAVSYFASSGNTATIIARDNYGYKVADKTTWPSFAGVTTPVIIEDYTKGNSYGTYPASYDGAQKRIWYFTPQTTSPGQHDGNISLHRGAWAPNICVSNDMDLTGARNALDNRRARFTTFTNGLATWSFGQGSLGSATATDEELSNFILEMYATPGDTLPSYTPLIIERKTGNWGVNVGTNSPQFSYHFKSKVAGFQQVCFESLTTTSDVVVRNSNGAADDVYLRNASGVASLRIASQGDAYTVQKANRRFTFSKASVRARVAVVYSAAMTIDADAGNSFDIVATNGVAFTVTPSNGADGQQITVKISNTSGGALGAVTWAAAFKLAAWTSPATGFNRSIVFEYNGVNWIEVSRTPADVPN